MIWCGRGGSGIWWWFLWALWWLQLSAWRWTWSQPGPPVHSSHIMIGMIPTPWLSRYPNDDSHDTKIMLSWYHHNDCHNSNTMTVIIQAKWMSWYQQQAVHDISTMIFTIPATSVSWYRQEWQNYSSNSNFTLSTAYHLWQQKCDWS